jgi:hypothetical protein
MAACILASWEGRRGELRWNATLGLSCSLIKRGRRSTSHHLYPRRGRGSGSCSTWICKFTMPKERRCSLGTIWISRHAGQRCGSTYPLLSPYAKDDEESPGVDDLEEAVAMARSRGRARDASPAWGEVGTCGRVEGIKNGRSEM